MPSYSVNVRAVVRATPTSPDALCRVEDWDIYDFEVPRASGEGYVIRCDQNVYVEADDEDAAIGTAKDEATGIVLSKGWTVDAIKLWVDPSIDVCLAPSPSMAM